MTAGCPTQGRPAALFIRQRDDLRGRLRRDRQIHLIGDNARSHDCQPVQRYLRRWGHRLVLHYLPTYAPETNPIERVWWPLHEELTRGHRCQTMEQLLDLIFTWLQQHTRFMVEDGVYALPPAA